jgi:FKBP-type peptidyl-prolyl cis-trans isomerase FklB
MTDGLKGNATLLDETELNAPSQRSARLQDEDGGGAQAARRQNQKEGDAFLAANKANAGVVRSTVASSTRSSRRGAGQRPTADDTVVCHYRGTLVGGQEFDSSLKRNKPASFGVKQVIKGWSEALQLMPVGSKWALYVPPNLALRGSVLAGAGSGPMRRSSSRWSCFDPGESSRRSKRTRPVTRAVRLVPPPNRQPAPTSPCLIA